MGSPNDTSCVWTISPITILFSVILNLLNALSADRYWAICHPISYMVHKNSGFTKWIISLYIFVGVVIGSLPVLGMNTVEDDYDYVYACLATEVFSTSFLCICCLWTIGTTSVIIVLNGFVIAAIRKRVIIHLSKIIHSWL
jgi:7 transmembrane receptor (rhodopsin family)